MIRARSVLAFAAALLVALAVAQPGWGHLPGSTFCSAKAPAKVELRCGKRAFYHGLGVVRWVRANKVRTLQSSDPQVAAQFRVVVSDHLWLMQAGQRWIREARHRLAPPVAACGASTAACAWYADGATQCEVSHEGGFTTDSNPTYKGRFQMGLSFETATAFGAAMERRYGRANFWPPGAQIAHAYEMWLTRGWGPWPPYSVYGCAAWHGRVYRG